MRIWLLIFVFSMGLLFLVWGVNANSGIEVQGLDAMTRIGRNQPVNGTSSIHIYAGRNETEPFQAIVTADGQPLVNVNVTMSALAGPGGATITDISLYREHYVTVITPTQHSQYPPQDHPDALIPFAHPDTGFPLNGAVYDAVPFDLAANENQPIWVDVTVPAATAPGDYTGILTVSADGFLATNLPVTLTVWNFTLPDTPLMPSNIGLSWRRVAEIYGLHVWDDAAQVFPLVRDYYDFLLGHSLSPSTFHTTAPDYDEATGAPDFNVETYDTAGTAAANLDYYINQQHANGYYLEFYPDWPYANPLTSDRTEAQAFVGQSAAYLAANGFAQGLHIDWIDEPSSASDYQDVRDWGTFFNQAEALYGSPVPMMITEQPIPENAAWGSLVGYVDIWVPWVGDTWVDEEYNNTDEISARLAAGDDVWSYAALAYYPNEYGDMHGWPAVLTEDHPPIWQLDYAPINYRIIPWINQHYGFSGLLYWDTLTWEDGHDVWIDAGNFLLDGQYVYNGDGFLIYPAYQNTVGFDGPVSSMRLKWVRESAEDFAYVELLHQQGQTAFALDRIHTVARHMADWDDDVSALYAARQAMGYMLHGTPTSVGLESAETQFNYPLVLILLVAALLLLTLLKYSQKMLANQRNFAGKRDMGGR